LSRSTTSTVSAATVRPWRGRRGDRRETACVAPGQRQRDAGFGIVERQRLADSARGAGDDNAANLFMG